MYREDTTQWRKGIGIVLKSPKKNLFMQSYPNFQLAPIAKHVIHETYLYFPNQLLVLYTLSQIVTPYFFSVTHSRNPGVILMFHIQTIILSYHFQLFSIS